MLKMDARKLQYNLSDATLKHSDNEAKHNTLTLTSNHYTYPNEIWFTLQLLQLDTPLHTLLLFPHYSSKHPVLHK